MTDLLSALAALTLGGSAAVLLLALLGRSSYRARWRCWAWALLCLRLLLPLPAPDRNVPAVQPPIQLPALSDAVVYQYVPDQSPSGAPEPAADTPEHTQGAPAPSAVQPAQSGADRPESAGFTLSLSQLLALLWLIGAAAVLTWTGIAHLRFLRHLRRWAKPVGDPATIQLFQWTAERLGLSPKGRPALLVCPELPAPMLAGLFRPVLLLPDALPEGEDLRFALLHELTHFRRRDVLLKALALAVSALHWFNPLMWYMVRLVDRDLELACDEDILTRLDAKEYAAYGRAILSAAERPDTFS